MKINDRGRAFAALSCLALVLFCYAYIGSFLMVFIFLSCAAAGYLRPSVSERRFVTVAFALIAAWIIGTIYRHTFYPAALVAFLMLAFLIFFSWRTGRAARAIWP